MTKSYNWPQINAQHVPSILCKKNRVIYGLEQSISRRVLPGSIYHLDIAYLNVGSDTFYICVMVDTASNFLMARIFDTLSLSNVTHFFLDMISFSGLPLVIISDRGGENKSMLTASCLAAGVNHLWTTPDASHQNSYAEQSIETLRQIIRKLFTHYEPTHTNTKLLD